MNEFTYDITFVHTTQALWYAHGRRDMGDGTWVIPMRFGEKYAEAYAQLDRGERNCMPSIDTAWEQFKQTGTIWKAVHSDISLILNSSKN